MSHIAIDARIINSTTGRYVERLLHYLQKIDTTNTYSVLVRKKDKEFWKPTSDNFKVVVADFDQYSFAEQLGFKKQLNELAPDLVHFTMPQQPIFYKHSKITTIHDLTLLNTYNSDKNWFVYRTKQFVGHFVFKQIIATNTKIITPSNFTRDAVLKFSKKASNKTSAIYLGADLLDTTLKPYKLPFKHFTLYVGKQSSYKNIRRLAAAHQRLIKKYPELGLVLVGSKNTSAKINEDHFKSKGYKNILFTGFLPDEQLNWLYSKAEVYIFPSLMEGFGLPGLEAMGHGTPVISSDATCLPEVYGDAAHYFNPNDTTDMARAVDEVLEDDSLRDELIKKGHEQFKKYSWKETAKKTHQVYLDALGEAEPEID